MRNTRGKQREISNEELVYAVDIGYEYFWTRPHRINLPDNPRNIITEFNPYQQKKADTLEPPGSQETTPNQQKTTSHVEQGSCSETN